MKASEIKTRILVCCHKKDIMATEKPYLPIQVGKQISDLDLAIQGDNTGENISYKNQSYCELTGMYWAWKNLKNVDVVGLCHYRRYFDFHNQCSTVLPMSNISSSEFGNIDLSVPDKVLKKVMKGSVVVAKMISYDCSGYDAYCNAHISDDLCVLKNVIIKGKNEKYAKAFFKVMQNSNKVMHYNMFIMRWADFDAYCSWIFNILGEVEKKIDISHYNLVQKRIFGYMAEHIFQMYLVANNKKCIEVPIMRFLDGQVSNYGDFTYRMMKILNDASMIPIKISNYFQLKRHPEMIYK